ncbi:MAG: 2-C-methyl-D-erythritol 4-phosphate cytidylyltransferase [Oscillospiraceae bacterium]|nr:2-C-methyl-D-erythritol 4-phosphate cytidylyltransferase [Oscillospiraceae bacterium]
MAVAAGKSSRMEGIDKQSALLDQTPVVARSLLALSECALVSEVVLVCPPGRVADYYEIVREYELDAVSIVVEGGETRQASVFAGVSACDAQATHFAIHDGARPLVTPGEIEDCIRAAIEHRAAALGVKVKDTLKRADKDGFIAGTIDREPLVAIQTPQVFEAGLYRRALALALQEKRDYTDDCQLVERLGQKVYIVRGEYMNIKITTPQDLAIAEGILQMREGGFAEWE